MDHAQIKDKLLFNLYKITMLAMREFGLREAWQLLSEGERTREMWDEWQQASEDRFKAFRDFQEFIEKDSEAMQVVMNLEKARIIEYEDKNKDKEARK